MSAPGPSRIAVVDVETTGLAPWRHDRIVEIAVVVMLLDGTIEDEYETLVNPERDIGPTRVHGINASDVLHAPRFVEIAGDVAELLSGTHVLAGHNISFDRNFLMVEYDRLGFSMPDMPTLCTCQLFGRNSLTACCAEYGIDFEGDLHRAIFDARATASLVRTVLDAEPHLADALTTEAAGWPVIPSARATRVTRDDAQRRIAEPPSYLQRITSEITHDTEASEPGVLNYLTLIDRVLEDRVIDPDEEIALVDAVSHLGLSEAQVRAAHDEYLHSLAVHALADGIVTDAERSDLNQVAHLIGMTATDVDGVLESASAQLQATGGNESATRAAEDLQGQRVCFTGELQSCLNGQAVTRDVAEALAHQAGLEIANSVTKKLDILVVADPNTQSGKAKKARRYGTRILAEPVFWQMIGVAVE